MKKQIGLFTAILFAVSTLMVSCSPEVHEHTFEEEWSSDETNHWHAATCEHKDEVINFEEHSFGGWTITREPTEEAEGSREKSCTVCEYTVPEVIEKLEHKHKFATEWTKDETNHWHAATCEHKDEVINFEEHSFGKWTVTKEATEEAEGSKERTCTVCGYTATEAIEKLEHTHKFASEWKSDETNHWHAATCEHKDEVINFEEHSFGKWTITKEATEDAKGSKERVCDVCKHKETAEIAQLNHKHVVGESWKNDDKNHWKECTGCKEQLESADHEYEWTVTKEATCTEEGSKTGVCEVCKKEVTEKIDVKGHSYSETWTSDAENHWHASTCGHEVTEGKTAHTFGDWTTTKEATCTKEGNKTRTCEVCKKEVTEKIPAKGHTLGIWTTKNEPTETEKGQMERVCEVCGETVTKELQPAPEGFRFVKGGTVTGALPAWLKESASDYHKGVFIKDRTVTLSDFYMGKYEVTQEEYASVMAGQKVTVNGTEYALGSNPNYCTDSINYTLFSGDVQEKRPVEGVTWYDAVWYCNALSKKESLTPAYNIEVTSVNSNGNISGATVTLVENATGYRLPTEAEWEYAARGGDPTKEDWNYVFSGANTAEDVSYSSSKNAGLDSVGWYCYNNITGITGDSDVTLEVSGKGTHQVGKKAPNRLGLYDMSGNVWEWCYDWKETITTTTPADGAASGSFRVYRGGGWENYASYASVSRRGNNGPHGQRDDLGFRVVRPKF